MFIFLNSFMMLFFMFFCGVCWVVKLGVFLNKFLILVVGGELFLLGFVVMIFFVVWLFLVVVGFSN